MYSPPDSLKLNSLNKTILYNKQIELCNQKSVFQIKIADSSMDINMAHQLVHDVYVREKYMKPNPSGMRKNNYTEQSGNTVFIGFLNSEFVMTVTAYVDQEHGLPCDNLFINEINTYRKRKRQLIEAGSMASLVTSTKLFYTFHHIIILHLIEMLNDDIIIQVHPKYERAYTKIFGFESIAGPKPYPEVNNSPALLMRLNLSKYPV